MNFLSIAAVKEVKDSINCISAHRQLLLHSASSSTAEENASKKRQNVILSLSRCLFFLFMFSARKLSVLDLQISISLFFFFLTGHMCSRMQKLMKTFPWLICFACEISSHKSFVTMIENITLLLSSLLFTRAVL